MNTFENRLLNVFFGITVVTLLFVSLLKRNSGHNMKRVENYMIIENQLVQINKQIIELYHKNYNYKINLGMLSNNINGYLKHINYINRIMITIESEELKEQTQSDLIMSRNQEGEVLYTNVPNTDEWKLVTYKNWYSNARTSKEPVWSSVYYQEDKDDKNFIINYSIPVHNRSREGGNAFIVNLEILGKIISHRY